MQKVMDVTRRIERAKQKKLFLSITHVAWLYSYSIVLLLLARFFFRILELNGNNPIVSLVYGITQPYTLRYMYTFPELVQPTLEWSILFPLALYVFFATITFYPSTHRKEKPRTAEHQKEFPSLAIPYVEQEFFQHPKGRKSYSQ